jgi:hypothetical protein
MCSQEFLFLAISTQESKVTPSITLLIAAAREGRKQKIDHKLSNPEVAHITFVYISLGKANI